jgi:hypothetical protein
VNNPDDELTIENVDEQVEELAQLRASPPSETASLARTIRNLQDMYAEDRRQASIWERISSRASVLADGAAINHDDAISKASGGSQPLQEKGTSLPSHDTLQVGSWNSLPQKFGKRLPSSRRWKWHNLESWLVAAILLLGILAIPLLYTFAHTHTASPRPSAQTATPQSQFTGIALSPQASSPATHAPHTATPSPTGTASGQPVSGLQTYRDQYFTILYPATWIVASVTTSDTYKQTVQFRPSATSPLFVNVNVMYASSLTGDLLLLLDPDVKLGTLLNTSTITYHGLPWVVDLVNATGSAPKKLEIAYSNQKAPYRIEFGGPPDLFDASTSTFNAIFSSFYPLNN